MNKAQRIYAFCGNFLESNIWIAEKNNFSCVWVIKIKDHLCPPDAEIGVEFVAIQTRLFVTYYMLTNP